MFKSFFGCGVELSSVIDLARRKNEPKTHLEFFQQHSFHTFVWPEAWRNVIPKAPLDWTEVDFEEASRDSIPKLKGVYAFKIFVRDTVMPQHGVIVYFGQTGAGSSGTLRTRFGQYLRDKKKTPKRPLFAQLFELWGDDLVFCYAPTPWTKDEILSIESALNDAVVPWCVTNDFSAEVRAGVKVLRS